MEGSRYLTEADVLRRAKEAIGIPMGEMDHTGRINTGKGAVGTILEESWFGYQANNDAQADFPEAGVELKVTPYIRNTKGIRAKERLVCNIIDYMTEYAKTFQTSDFWVKCNTMLIMSYEHRKDIPKSLYTIDEAILFKFPLEDLVIIEQDWRKLMNKIRAGQAHLITEGDTLYLAACTKGANSHSLRRQPFSEVMAMQRAYSLKSSYMTRILNRYIFGTDVDERIIKDWHDLEEISFEDYIISKLRHYFGMSQEELMRLFDIHSVSKGLNALLISKMLQVNGDITKTAEFQSANIILKTIRVQKNGHIRESMSFPAFKFTELIKEEWETSTVREYLEPAKFLFMIFVEDASGTYHFNRTMFWNIPADDLEEVHRVWQRTVDIIKEGVVMISDGKCVHNNLPKRFESPVAHVRPHAKNSKDTYPLPDGRLMPKQCFWLNNTYLEQQIGR